MDLSFTPPGSLARFFLSRKFVSFAVGPYGSTKTTAGLMKIAYEAARMAPCSDGIRRSRCVVVRNTRQMLTDTTLKDFLKWFPDGVAGNLKKTGLEFTLRWADVECEVLFRGLDDQNDVRRLLSLQLSFGVIDEFKEVHPDIYEALAGRVGRYPDKVIVPPKPQWGVDDKGDPIGGCVDDEGHSMKKVWGMSNPPDADTWWETTLSEPPDNMHVTIQPSGLSPEADWVHLLDSGYYESLAELHAADPDWVDVFVHGKFGKSLQGHPVFRCFDKETHVAKEPIKAQLQPLVIGVDAGLNPTAVVTQQSYDGRILVLDAITGIAGGMGALRFAREMLKPLLNNKYPGKNLVLIIDPAAFQRAQTDEKTVADIFKAEGFTVKAAKTNTISARLAAVETFMTRTVDGKAGFLIDPGCTTLIMALRSKYRYRINNKGDREDSPEKSHPWSDYCFIAGTPVLTPQGPTPIEMLGIGDTLCTHDGLDIVTGVGSRLVPQLLRLDLSDGTSVTCTPDHPFLLNNTCPLRADALTSQHILTTKEQGAWANEHGTRNTDLPLTVIRKVFLSEGGRVFNITAGRTHRYYAGSALVKNCDALQYACLHHDGGGIFGGTHLSQRREIKPSPYHWAM